MATRVYKYHLQQPRDPATRTAVWDQLRAAHRYYNKLIEIERKRRVAYREVRSESSAVVSQLEGRMADLNAKIEAVVADIQRLRKETRSSKTKVGDVVAMRTLKAERKQLATELKAAKAVAQEDPKLKEAATKVDAAAHTEALKARAECGAFWGTYLLIEAAVQAARQSRTDPAFKRWEGTGRIGVQLQKGAEVAEVVNSDDTRVQIGPIDLDQLVHARRGDRRRAARTTLRIRIGTQADKRTPIWAEFPLTMHRPLPDGAKIMGVVVNVTKKADRAMYSADVVVRVMDVVPSARPGVVGIDIGWRKMTDDGETRVAYWYDDQGAEGRLNVPADVQTQIDKSRAIRATRDQLRDTVLPQLVALLKPITKDEEQAKRTEALHAWRSCDRLHKLFYFWRGHRAEGDSAFFAAFTAWHHRDRHLWQYEAGLARNAFRQRQEVYKVFAASVAQRYGHVVLERWDLRQMAERKPVEEDTADSRAPNRQRQDVGPSLFRLALINAVERDGGRVLRTPAAFTTRDCHACQHRHEEAIVELEHVCDNCGEVWDQDANAARNLLASGQVMLKDPELLAAANPPPKPKKARFANKKRKEKPAAPTEKDSRSQVTT